MTIDTFAKKRVWPLYYNRKLSTATKVAPFSSESIGSTGRRYSFKNLIQERPYLGRVWLATSGGYNYILKDVPENIYSQFREDIWPHLRETSHIRLPLDTIPGQRVLVYEYLDDDFLALVRRKLPLQARKQILKSALQGISELHDRDIVHLDVKPDNIMVNWHQNGTDFKIEKVQVADLENAAHLPPGRCIKGMLPGNENWRSPEGHCKAELNKPSDMFSFGAMCIYAILKQVIFGPDEDFKKHQAQGVFAAIIRLQRQISYFGDEEGMKGLLKHIGDNKFDCKILQMLWEGRESDDIPYAPFSEWPDISDFKFNSLIKGIMNLDPKCRLSAKQALDHPWFSSEPHRSVILESKHTFSN